MSSTEPFFSAGDPPGPPPAGPPRPPAAQPWSEVERVARDFLK